MTAPFVEDLGPIPMSTTLAGTLARAANYAQSQQHVEVTLEHLLLALTEDDDACIVMTSAGVNLDQLKTDISNHVGRIENRLPPEHPGTATISDELRRILNAAAAAASGRRNDINGGIVLAAIIGDAHSSAAALLQTHGLTFGVAIEVVKQRFSPEAEAARQQSRPAPRPTPAPPKSDNPQQSDAESFLSDARSRVENRRAGPPAAGSETQYTAPSESAPQRSPAPPPNPPENEPTSGAPMPGGQTPSTPAARPAPQPGPPREAHTQPPAPAQPPPQPGQTWTPPPSHTQPPQPRPYRAPPPLHPEVGMRPPPPTGPFRTEAESGPTEERRTAPRPAPASPPPQGPARQRSTQHPAPAAAQASTPAKPRAPLPSVEEVFGAPPAMELERAPTARRQGGPGQAPAPVQAPSKPASGRSAGTPSKKRRRARSDAVQTGQLIENIPRVMRVALPSLVEARIAKSEVKNLADGMIGDGTAYRHGVLITRAMSVRLRAPDGGFFIETSSPETQWIENALGLMADDYASWRWTVTPKARGRRRLQLIVSARTVGADGLAAETALPDQIVEIKVRTNYARTFTMLFGWASAAVAGGLLARFGEELWASLDVFLKTLGGQ